MPDSFPSSVAESRDYLRVPAYPEYMNALGHMKAGHVLKLIDIAGSISAKKYLGNNNVVVTASVDRTDFINPVRRWELITLESKLTQVWKTSMEAQITVSAWSFQTNETRDIATAYLVFVALDNHRHKTQVPPLRFETEAESQLAQAADIRKKLRTQEGKQLPIMPIDPADDNPVCIERLMTPNDANHMNNVFGGVILDIIDEAGSLAACRQALGGTVIGVRLDRMSFLEPAFIGETIQAMAIVTKTWHTSQEVQVEVTAHNPATGQVRPIAQSYLVYVSLGPEGQPVQVPPWIPRTSVQEERAQAADIRRENRRQEGTAIEAISPQAG